VIEVATRGLNVMIVTSQLCGQFAAWSSAWLQGTAAFDDVLSHARVPGALVVDHTVGGTLTSVGEVLVEWRRGGESSVRAVFPVPGDVRGVPGPAPYRVSALEAGASVVGSTLGLVPERLARTPSSASDLIRWHVYGIDAPPADFVQLEDAAHDLTECVRESASVLAVGDPGIWSADLREELSDARRAGERLSLPVGFPQRAVSLLAQAERLALVLELAHSGATPTAHDAAARADALRPLATAVRRARVAGYNVLAR
jgi:hypothetical protein